jgi:hypothetical protein
MWDLWWIKLHWNRFHSEFFGFPLSILYHSMLTHVSSGGSDSGSSSIPLRNNINNSDALRMAPQVVEAGRCEIGRSRRPQIRPVSSYPAYWEVRVRTLLYVAGKISRSCIKHKPLSLSRCQSYIRQ